MYLFVFSFSFLLFSPFIIFNLPNGIFSVIVCACNPLIKIINVIINNIVGIIQVHFITTIRLDNISLFLICIFVSFLDCVRYGLSVSSFTKLQTVMFNFSVRLYNNNKEEDRLFDILYFVFCLFFYDVQSVQFPSILTFFSSFSFVVSNISLLSLF